ncbi:Tannase/feruloyl esterase [Kalmanozyma brasiliensis GHG001]|uniref:Carboxylic ester hydrolase n=1 Tax=Kalmanozyma brasiliensis (strain GHG001) TaxID=1365824 RepID=V5ETT3_KALBG|nr:Tannase/feruloyl esterase [Kalmanozyma brasiliensis GHG001]EST06493.1 Tannase/feruloyl esterase [Kalmanozyma brasiliensis GHG001]
MLVLGRVPMIAVAVAIVTQARATLVHRASSRARQDVPGIAQSCSDLPDSLEELLLEGLGSDGVPLEISDTYAFHYPAGSNPTAEKLYSVIPETSFGPKDDKAGAMSVSAGFGKKAVIADDGYGEESRAPYSQSGGLPSFCRIGGMVSTSEHSRAHFEVWLPLPDTNEEDETTDDTVQAESYSSDQQSEAQALKANFKRAPTSGWTKRLVFVVGGGLSGASAFSEMKQTMARYRVAVASTNGGHFSAFAGTKWLPDNPEGWLHRAIHLSTMVAKLAVSIFFYGVPPSTKGKNNVVPESKLHVFYSYIKGCSTGGRAAMAEAQRYPLDCDGVLAGSPAIEFNKLKAYQVHVNTFLANNKSEGHFPPSAYPMIHKAVLQACDASDGVVDGIVSDPRSCKPDFAKLIGCTGKGTAPSSDSVETAPESLIKHAKRFKHIMLPRQVSPQPASDPSAPLEVPGGGASSSKDSAPPNPSAPTCLTDPQLQTLSSIYTDYTISTRLIREAVLPGSEMGWTISNAIVGKIGASPSAWFHYQVLNSTSDLFIFDAGTAITPTIIDAGERLDAGQTITFIPDLSRFFDAGGKLMHYHGLADPLVPPLVSPRYFERVHAVVGEKASESYKLYMIPGMLHCRGGAGCWNFGGAGQIEPGARPLRADAKHDMLLALMEWVEKGRVPNEMVGTAYRSEDGGAPKRSDDKTPFGNGVRLTRPLCAYPMQARLRRGGRRDTSDASAFECS